MSQAKIWILAASVMAEQSNMMDEMTEDLGKLLNFIWSKGGDEGRNFIRLEYPDFAEIKDETDGYH